MGSKRIQADIRELQQPLYRESGIFYEPNEENILNGSACIFGPTDTPYEDCPMLYSFTLSSTFPFDSPIVQFKTSDGHTRFHPNMYMGGKVCLSILGTWSGPSWSSIMRISTVLVTLQSIMTANPITNEPGYAALEPNTEKALSYSRFVEVACIRYILERAEAQIQPRPFQPFVEEFQRRLPGTLERLEGRLLRRLEETGEVEFTNVPYQMCGKSGYRSLLDRVVKLKTACNGPVQ